MCDIERQAGERRFRETLLEAADVARSVGYDDGLVRAALGNTRGMQSETGIVDEARIATVQAALRIPVLAAIPAILLDADRVALKRRRRRRIWYALAATGTVLVAAAGGYTYNNGLPSFGSPEQRAPELPAPAPPAGNPIPAPAPPAGGNPASAPAGQGPG